MPLADSSHCHTIGATNRERRVVTPFAQHVIKKEQMHMQLATQHIRVFAIIIWIFLPTVMYGGYSLLRLLQRQGSLTPFQAQYFRAGHAHAGVLLLMALLYFLFLGQTRLSAGQAIIAMSILPLGIILQSGGFFLHLALGKPGKASVGTAVTTVGAILLVVAIVILVVGLLAA
jgi:hypothetical protein